MTVRQNKNRATKDGRSFYFDVNYTDELGRYKHYTSKMYKTRQEAKEGENLFWYKLNKGLVKEDISFNQLIEKYKEERKDKVKPQSFLKLSKAIEHISDSLGQVKVAKLTYNQYEQFRKEIIAKGFSVKYSNSIFTYAKSLMRYAETYYGISNRVPFMFDNFRKVQTEKKELHYITLDEFDNFVAFIPHLEYRAFFTTLFYMGTRLGEANALKWTDIDFKKNTLDINKTVSTKHAVNGLFEPTSPKTQASYRVLPMPNAVIDILSELKEYWMQDSGFNEDWYVFGGDRPLPESTIASIKNKAFKEAGLNSIRVHDFRHSCASLLINHGANISIVSAYLGHASTQETLNTYVHFYGSKLNEVVDLLNKQKEKG